MKTVQMGPISTFKRRASHLALGLGLAATLAFGAVMPTMAAPGTGTVAVTAGTLSAAFGTISASGAALLDGTSHDVVLTAPIVVTDFSGTQAGWNTTLSMGVFQHRTVAGTPGVYNANLGVSDVSIAPSGGTCVVGIECSDPTLTNGITGPVSYTLGASAPIVYSTAAETGIGKYDLSTAITITVPATALAGTYDSTMEITAVAGPN